MSRDSKGYAESALADVFGIIVILEAMCVAELSAGHKLNAAAVDWLVGQQEALCERVSEAIAQEQQLDDPA